MAIQVEGGTEGTLADVIDRILDKGLVINADITVSVVGVHLLDLRIRAALASFETAAAYGLEFPSGTRLPESAGRLGLPPRDGAGQVTGEMASAPATDPPMGRA